ncbi:MAG: asparaginase [Gemmatimonadaceae bacterium]
MRAFLLASAVTLAAPLAASLGASLGAQAAPPAVHVVATGGTISNTGGPNRRTGDELVRGIPGIETVATVTVEQFSNVASGSITPAHWKAIALRVNELFRTRSDLRGVVVTHGTDTMEETAYFLDLTVRSCHPVIVTGAMRLATDVGADGPANLRNAIRAAATPDAEGRGTMVLLNDEIFAARDVTKMNTSRMDAFAAPGMGAEGVADPDAVAFRRPAPRRSACAAAPFAIAEGTQLPRVDIVYSYAGADSVAIQALVAAGAKGIVIAGVGRGGSTPAQSAALQRATEKGVIVVISSRTGSGRVPVGAADSAPSSGRGATVGAGDLNPQKARILLMLALAAGYDAAKIADAFRKY